VKTTLGVHRITRGPGLRLAVLHFLNADAEVPARLLHVYFVGDKFPDGRECPQTQSAGEVLLMAREVTHGVPEHHPLADRCHTCFVPVAESAVT
jgi:hypothetical protein